MSSFENVEIRIRATDQASPVFQKVGQAAQGLKSPLQQAENAAAGAGNTLGNLGPQVLQGLSKIPVGVALAATALAGLAFGIEKLVEKSKDQLVDFAGQTRTLMRETGASAELASGLLTVFERFGQTGDDASRSLGIFSRHLRGIEDLTEKAIMGGRGFVGTMQDLRVSYQTSAGAARPMLDVLLDVADRFHAMPDGAEKTAIALEMFGRSGKDMIPVLDQGRAGLQELMEHAAKLGLTLSGENVDQVKRYVMAQKDLSEALGGIKLQLGIALMPVFASVAKATAKLAEGFNSYAVPALRTMGAILQPLAAQILPLFDQGLRLAGTAVQGIQAAFRGLAQLLKPVIDWFHGIWQQLKAIDWQKHWQDVKEWAIGIWNSIKDKAQPVLEWLKGWAEWAVEKLAQGMTWTFTVALPWLNENLVKPALEWLSGPFWNWVSDKLSKAWGWTFDIALPWLSENVVKPALDWLRGPFWDWAGDKLSKAWDWTWEIALPWAGGAVQRALDWLQTDFWDWFERKIIDSPSRDWTFNVLLPWLGERVEDLLNWFKGPFWEFIGPKLEQVGTWTFDIALPWLGKRVEDLLGWFSGPFWDFIKPLVGATAEWTFNVLLPWLTDPIGYTLQWLNDTALPYLTGLQDKTWTFEIQVPGADLIKQAADDLERLNRLLHNPFGGGGAGGSGGGSGGGGGGYDRGGTYPDDQIDRQNAQRKQERDNYWWEQRNFYVNTGDTAADAEEKATADAKAKYGFARGGIVLPRPGGINAVLGEAGRAEAVIPLDRAGAMGFGGNVTIHEININTAATDATGIALDAARAFRDALGLQRRMTFLTR